VHNRGRHRRTCGDQAAAGEFGSCVGLLLSGRLLRYKVLPFPLFVSLLSGGYQCGATFLRAIRPGMLSKFQRPGRWLIVSGNLPQILSEKTLHRHVIEGFVGLYIMDIVFPQGK
jgi:hypothetical protein